MLKQHKEDIIATAIILRCNYNTKDPFLIAKRLGIEIVYVDVDKKILKGASYYSDTRKEIKLNSNYTPCQQRVICAHELGHIILEHTGKNYYKGADSQKEYCANLFAVALLFNKYSFNCELTDMSGYTLNLILEMNL